MFDKTGSQSTRVHFKVPVIMRIVLFNSVSSIWQCMLLPQTGAQYSSVLYTRVSADVQSTCVLLP